MKKYSIPEADLTSPNFANDFNRNNMELGFNAVSGFENIKSRNGRTIEEIKELLYADLASFADLPQNVKDKYIFPAAKGQRGYTPDGVEQSGAFRELREHIMLGRTLPEGHPTLEYQPLFYAPNPPIDDVPTLVPHAEELLECLDQLTLQVFEKVAHSLDLPKGTIASKLVYGQPLLRLHMYPAADEVVAARTVDNVEAIGGTKVNGVEVVDLIYQGKLLQNVLRASPHPDTGYFTWLLGSEVGGLNILHADGTALPFETAPGKVVGNAADFIEIDIPGYRSVVHLVGLTPETALKKRLSIADFVHPRPTAFVGDNENSVLLFRRLKEIGYDIKDLDGLVGHIKNLTPDKEMIGKMLVWENDQLLAGRMGNPKLGKYFHLTNSKTGSYEVRE